MKVAIIGAGKMGQWFAKFFLDEGVTVIVSDKSKRTLSKIERELGVEVTDNINAVKTADMVLICVRIEDFEDVIKEIHSHVRPDQVIMDICSFKEFPVKVMHKYIKTGTTLGIHPMFGPETKSIRNQSFIFTPTNSREETFAKKFEGWLEGRHVKVFIMSPKKHDKLWAAILGLPHFIRFYFLTPTERRLPQLRRILYRIVSLTLAKKGFLA